MRSEGDEARDAAAKAAWGLQPHEASPAPGGPCPAEGSGRVFFSGIPLPGERAEAGATSSELGPIARHVAPIRAYKRPRGGREAERRPGDWVCDSCGKLVFAYRQICCFCKGPRSCGEPKGSMRRVRGLSGDETSNQ